VADWLGERLSIADVFLKFRSDAKSRGRTVRGKVPMEPVRFVENGLHFQANLVEGQKTGFFFDQRDNRARIGALAKNRSVLNLFAYTGGFSIIAVDGGHSEVTSVDLAKPASAEAQRNWQLNGLPEVRHRTSASDASEFL